MAAPLCSLHSAFHPHHRCHAHSLPRTKFGFAHVAAFPCVCRRSLFFSAPFAESSAGDSFERPRMTCLLCLMHVVVSSQGCVDMMASSSAQPPAALPTSQRRVVSPGSSLEQLHSSGRRPGSCCQCCAAAMRAHTPVCDAAQRMGGWRHCRACLRAARSRAVAGGTLLPWANEAIITICDRVISRAAPCKTK